ncbi:putative Leucine Rich repeat [Trypanosoma vivax]|nr:putative Leucine Rich repeat [Trypanosoma vivax]
MHSEAASVYVDICNREHTECALELVYALDNNTSEVSLSNRSVPLKDVDVVCIAEALRTTKHCVRVLNIEGNSFGLPGLQALLEAIELNPGIVRELRLGRNKLKDQAAVVIGHMLSRSGCGLKVLDLSENDITKLGVIPIAAALGNESCDIVELSFHNNKIEADAAAYLGQALRQAGRLKHLHLGYNAIRETGATQLARCIPLSANLSTLDLTANRIGASGGKELARALMSSSCNIQRLNLRHNLFDSETIELFADVLSNNTSLIQLFLGFMNPAPKSAALVLAAVPNNRSMLLLDIYGWKLPPEGAWGLIDNIQKGNTTLVALVTDACQSVAQQIDHGNEERDRRGLHAIYVGPDDRDAYMATKSLRRVSQVHSRRPSRTPSFGPPSSRNAALSDAVTPVSRCHKDAPSTTQKASVTHSRRSAHLRQQRVEGTSSQQDSVRSASQNSVMERQSRSEQQHDRAVSSRDTNANTSTNGRLKTTKVEARGTHESLQSMETLKRLVEDLRTELVIQKEKHRALELRVIALEGRKECHCSDNPRGHSSTLRPQESVPLNRTPSTRNVVAVDAVSRSEVVRRSTDVVGATSRSASVREITNRMSWDRNRSNVATPCDVDHRSLDVTASSPLPFSTSLGPAFASRRRNTATPLSRADQNSSRMSDWDTRGAPAEYPQVGTLRVEPSVPPAEPLELPSENRPAEVSLQTSARPRDECSINLGPGPSKDRNPPRRKGSIQMTH